jgi:hypothetical protein
LTSLTQDEYAESSSNAVTQGLRNDTESLLGCFTEMNGEEATENNMEMLSLPWLHLEERFKGYGHCVTSFKFAVH